MRASVTATFSEPEEFQAAMSKTGCLGLVFVEGGRFHARSIEVELNHLRIVSVEERRPRVAFMEVPPGIILVSLPLKYSTPPVWSGISVNSLELITLGPGASAHMRIEGSCHWGAIWVPVPDLARYGHALTGTTIPVPPGVCHWRSRARPARQLRQLFLSAIRTTHARSPTVAGPEAAHGLEQQLIYFLVECLYTASADAASPAVQRELEVMAGFEALIRDNPDGTLTTPAASAALEVSVRFLRRCCTEHLGISPTRYIHFHQMQLAYRALRRDTPRTASVAEVMERFGFRNFRRFADSYQRLYGEPPLETLRRGPRREVPDLALSTPEPIAEFCHAD